MAMLVHQEAASTVAISPAVLAPQRVAFTPSPPLLHICSNSLQFVVINELSRPRYVSLAHTRSTYSRAIGPNRFVKGVCVARRSRNGHRIEGNRLFMFLYVFFLIASFFSVRIVYGIYTVRVAMT